MTWANLIGPSASAASSCADVEPVGLQRAPAPARRRSAAGAAGCGRRSAARRRPGRRGRAGAGTASPRPRASRWRSSPGWDRGARAARRPTGRARDGRSRRRRRAPFPSPRQAPAPPPPAPARGEGCRRWERRARMRSCRQPSAADPSNARPPATIPAVAQFDADRQALHSGANTGVSELDPLYGRENSDTPGEARRRQLETPCRGLHDLPAGFSSEHDARLRIATRRRRGAADRRVKHSSVYAVGHSHWPSAVGYGEPGSRPMDAARRRRWSADALDAMPATKPPPSASGCRDLTAHPRGGPTTGRANARARIWRIHRSQDRSPRTDRTSRHAPRRALRQAIAAIRCRSPPSPRPLFDFAEDRSRRRIEIRSKPRPSAKRPRSARRPGADVPVELEQRLRAGGGYGRARALARRAAAAAREELSTPDEGRSPLEIRLRAFVRSTSFRPDPERRCTSATRSTPSGRQREARRRATTAGNTTATAPPSSATRARDPAC